MSEAMPFTYERPVTTAGSKSKTLVPLVRSDLVYAAVQVVREGGENNLHSHPHLDGFWFVLAGKVRFYGADDGVIAEIGPNEGVLIPRGTKYWFERVGTEELEVLQVHARDEPQAELRRFYARVDHQGTPSGDVEIVGGTGEPVGGR